MSKILEGVVFDQIVAHFNRNNLFSPRQSGFCYGHSTNDVLLDGTLLKQVCSTKCLGVFLDSISPGRFMWTMFRGKLSAINQVKPVSPGVLQLLYQAYILPILDYCDVVWLPSNSIATRHLERLHSMFYIIFTIF